MTAFALSSARLRTLAIVILGTLAFLASGPSLRAQTAAAGALFGATSDWFQRAVARMAGGAMETLSRLDLPSWSRSSSAFGPSEAPALLAGYGPVLIVAGLVAVMAMAIVGWVLRED